MLIATDTAGAVVYATVTPDPVTPPPPAAAQSGMWNQVQVRPFSGPVTECWGLRADFADLQNRSCSPVGSVCTTLRSDGTNGVLHAFYCQAPPDGAIK